MRTLLLSLITFLSILIAHVQVYAQGPGNAIMLDGVNDYIACSTDNRGISSSVTVEAWVKTSSTAYQWVVGKYNNDADRGYHLIIKGGKAAFAGRDGSGTYRSSGYSTTLVNDNQWHHLAGVCDNGTWTLYVDGVMVSEEVTGYKETVLTSSAVLAIGKDYLANNEYFRGQIDQVRIWNKALDYNSIREGMCKTLPFDSNGLVAYYSFNETALNHVKDLSIKKINGTFINMDQAKAWIISGAPIGDQSVHLYPSSWSGQQLSTSTFNNNLFSVTSSSSELKGVHIYSVSSKPNTLSGIENSTQVSDYVGVFKVGGSTSQYTVTGQQANAECFRTLYQRLGNTATTWVKASASVKPVFPSLTSVNPINEFILNTSPKGTAKITGNNTFCSGSNTTLSINTTGNVIWSTGESTKSIQVTKGGVYTVIVDEEGCTYSDAITVTEILPPVLELGPDKTICERSVVHLQAPTGEYTYKWSTGSTASTINVSEAGNYWVQVTNTTGCTSTDNITISVIPQPTVGLAATYQICPNDEITLDASLTGAAYKWSTGANTPSITTNEQGPYWVDITLGSCTYRYNTTVSHKALPAFAINGPTQICELGVITLTVPATGAIQWSTGATTPSITVDKGGKYSVQTIIDGCTLTEEINVTELAFQGFDLGGDITICNGEKVKLTAPDNMKSYQWSTGATTQSIEVTRAGTYRLEVTTQSGCIYQTAKIIAEKPEPLITMPTTVNACYGEVVTLNATTDYASYIWSNGQTSATINVLAPTEVSVKIIVDGCAYEREVKVLSDECPIIPNIITPNNDGKNDTFVISGLNIDNIDIDIFNRWGKSVYKSSGYDNKWATEATGIYYYHIKSRLTQKDYKGWVEVVK